MKLLCILLFSYIQFVACQNGMYELFKYFPLYKNVILIQNIFFLAYKFCVSESDSVSQKCQAILKGNSQVSCVPVIDRLAIHSVIFNHTRIF